MEEKKTKFVVYFQDADTYRILGHVNTFAEGQELLVKRFKEMHGGDYKKEIEEILSHTEDEMEGRDGLILYKSNSYYFEGIERVPGYVDEDELVAKDVTLGEILKRELANVKGLKWKMKINTKDKEDFYLQVSGRNKVPVGNKYERIIGLPTHYVDWYYEVKSDTEEYISEKTFPDVDWKTVSAEEIDRRLKEYFLSRKKYFSEEEAFNSLPNELVLEKGSGGSSISPYDKYGYQIMNISAYGTADDKGVFVHIRRK